jgi:hypothetical protein
VVRQRGALVAFASLLAVALVAVLVVARVAARLPPRATHTKCIDLGHGITAIAVFQECDAADAKRQYEAARLRHEAALREGKSVMVQRSDGRMELTPEAAAVLRKLRPPQAQKRG